MSQIILKRSSLASFEAIDLLAEIEAKRVEVDKLSLALGKRKSLSRSRGLSIKQLSERIEKGNYLASDDAKLKAELERLKPLLAEAEKYLEESQSEYDRARSELSSLVEKFDAEYVAINYALSPEIQS